MIDFKLMKELESLFDSWADQESRCGRKYHSEYSNGRIKDDFMCLYCKTMDLKKKIFGTGMETVREYYDPADDDEETCLKKGKK